MKFLAPRGRVDYSQLSVYSYSQKDFQPGKFLTFLPKITYIILVDSNYSTDKEIFLNEVSQKILEYFYNENHDARIILLMLTVLIPHVSLKLH